jgi:hypothetical protein
MKLVTCLLALAALAVSAADKSETLEGKLTVRAGEATTIRTSSNKTITLDGAPATRKVLNDDRLNGMDVHATGHFTARDRFFVDAPEKHGLTVHRDNKEKLITYWCAVCELRSYAPGPCACCGGDTSLDLHDPDKQ